MLKTNKHKIKCDSTCVCKKSNIDDLLTYLCTVSDTNIHIAEHVLDSFLKRCTKKDNSKFGNIENGDTLIRGYALIGYVRDILHGKGKRDLAYAYIWVWYQYYPLLAKQALFSFIHIRDIARDMWIRPYGSWKDIKLFAEYVYKRTNNKNHELIQYCVTLFVNEIRKINLQQKQQQNNSNVKKSLQVHNYYAYLALKWCPRERSRLKWLFQRIALSYCLQERQTNISKSLQFRHFRKTVNRLSKNIMNVEKALSTGTLDKLEIYNMSVSTQLKYFWSLHNQSNDICRRTYFSFNHFKSNIRKLAHPINHTQYTFPIQLLIRRTLETTQMKKYKLYSLPRLILQHCWESLHTPHKLQSSLVIVDVSRTMDSVLHKAIVTGIYLSENTIAPFQNKIVLYSGKVSIVDLGSCKDFCEKVNMVLQVHRGDSTDFLKLVDTLEDVLDEIVSIYPECNHYIRHLTLILISNQLEQNKILYLQSMRFKPFIVLYHVSSKENQNNREFKFEFEFEFDNYNHNYLNTPGLLYFEEDNVNTLIHYLANPNKSKKKSKAKSKTGIDSSVSYPKTNTKYNYFSILNSSRYKYLVHDIMLQLLTVDDLKCTSLTT